MAFSRVLPANVRPRVRSNGSTSKYEFPPSQRWQRTWYPYCLLDRGSTRHIDDALEVLYSIKDHTYRWMGWLDYGVCHCKHFSPADLARLWHLRSFLLLPLRSLLPWKYTMAQAGTRHTYLHLTLLMPSRWFGWLRHSRRWARASERSLLPCSWCVSWTEIDPTRFSFGVLLWYSSLSTCCSLSWLSRSARQ